MNTLLLPFCPEYSHAVLGRCRHGYNVSVTLRFDVYSSPMDLQCALIIDRFGGVAPVTLTSRIKRIDDLQCK